MIIVEFFANRSDFKIEVVVFQTDLVKTSRNSPAAAVMFSTFAEPTKEGRRNLYDSGPTLGSTLATLGSIVGSALCSMDFPQFINPGESGFPRILSKMSSPNTERCALLRGNGDFGCAELDLKGPTVQGEKMRTNNFYLHKWDPIQPSTSSPKLDSYNSLPHILKHTFDIKVLISRPANLSFDRLREVRRRRTSVKCWRFFMNARNLETES